MKMWHIVAGVLVGVVVALVGTMPVAAQDTSNFTIQEFTADYSLGRNAQNASTMQVEEKIVAEFPQYDQNHGIERALPSTYDGRSLHLNVESVTNAEGESRQYSTRNKNDNTILRIGDPDAYVRGSQTYIITYSYQDVTKNFDTHDELYWDTNGTQWQQVVEDATARVHMNATLAEALNGQVSCFVGVQGSNETCTHTQTKTENGGVTFTFEAGRPLGAGENMSFVIGFMAGTFAPYQPTPAEQAQEALMAALTIVWWVITIIVMPIAVIWMIIVLLHTWRKYGREPEGRGTIVPQYLPPKEASVLMSAQAARKPQHATTAQIIDFAVRHYVRIHEVKSKNWFKKKTYELEVVQSPDSLREGERELFDALFMGEQTPGTRVNLDDIARKRYKQMTKLAKNMKRRAEEQGFFVLHKKQQTKFYWIGGLLLALGILTAQIPIVIVAIATLIVASKLRPRTEKGVALEEYLQGLKMYIKLAETERLKVLQSPEGAEKVNVDDKRQMVKLYERVLPYAILLGVEKEWGKQFTQFTDKPPEWYHGSSANFSAVLFVGSLNNFTSATSTTFSAPTNSSGSGFSSGGGFSGGGGGGGGGGGW